MDTQIDLHQIEILAQNHDVHIFVGHEYASSEASAPYLQLDADFSKASTQINQQLSAS